MTRRFLATFSLVYAFAGCPVFAQEIPPAAPAASPSASPSASPAGAAVPRATLASAPGGYLDGPKPAIKLGYNSVNVDGQYIAITFDDGPHATHTPRLLGILAQRKVKATFYLVGQCAAEFPDIVKRIGAEGHELANHSWSHPNLAKMSDDAVRGQIERTQQAIGQSSGATPKTMRPPYGSITDRQRRWITEDLGLKIIMWSVDPLDWQNRNAATVANRIISRTHPGAIILAHDIHGSTVDAMPEVLDTLLARGFQFVTVSELLAMEKPPAPKPPQPAESKPKAAPAAGGGNVELPAASKQTQAAKASSKAAN